MRTLLAVLAFVLCGCVASQPASTPQTLEEVNAVLDDRWAVIETTDGRTIELIEDVVINPTTTTYTDRSTQKQKVLPTEMVLQVRFLKSQRGVRKGALIGAMPGLLVTGFGLYSFATLDSDTESFGPGLAALFFTVAGAVAAPVGAILGGVIGGVTDHSEPFVVYEGPLRIYLSR